MKRFNLPPEPPYFDKKVRQKGLRFINKYPNPKKYTAHWSQCKECARDIRQAFQSLCAYSVISCDAGHIDHFISQSECCQMNSKHLIYEWSNYRYSDHIVNQSKNAARSADLLDPLEIEDKWFRIVLPTGKLEMTNQILDTHRDRAESTIKLLHLNEGIVLERRRSLIGGFIQGRFTLEHVINKAPMIAHEFQQRLEATNLTTTNDYVALVFAGEATMGELRRTSLDAYNIVLNAIYA